MKSFLTFLEDKFSVLAVVFSVLVFGTIVFVATYRYDPESAKKEFVQRTKEINEGLCKEIAGDLNRFQTDWHGSCPRPDQTFKIQKYDYGTLFICTCRPDSKDSKAKQE